MLSRLLMVVVMGVTVVGVMAEGMGTVRMYREVGRIRILMRGLSARRHRIRGLMGVGMEAGMGCRCWGWEEGYFWGVCCSKSSVWIYALGLGSLNKLLYQY